MKKAKKTKAKKETVILVKVAILGKKTEEISLLAGATVEDALNAVAISVGDGQKITVSGVTAEPEDILENGDILTVMTSSAKGGTR